MRVNTNVSHRPQQQLVLDNFGGVDFSSSPLSMASNRASFACNLINDNGINHKRPGWEEQLKLPGKINGIYHYNTNGHNALIIYVYVNGDNPRGAFYEAIFDKDEGKYSKPTSALKTDVNWVDGRVQFYPQSNKVYIIGCGDYLVYGSWGNNEDETPKYELKRVVDTDVYVPTTSVSRKPRILSYKFDEEGKKITNEDGSFPLQTTQEENAGSIIDNVNILTKKRKNTFVGYKYNNEIDFKADYITDRPFKKETLVVTVNFFDNSSLVYKEGKVIAYKGDDEQNKTDFSIPAGDNWFNLGEGTEYYRGTGDPNTTYANVTAEFEVADEDGFYKKASMITNCRFGTLFGAAGNSDRLFLSGNPDYPNADFYSEFDDYTYFTEQSQTVMGSDDLPITGYVRVSDSTLMTMKAGAVYEPSVYYRQAKEEDAYVDEEKTVKKIVFTRWSGGIGEACLNPYLTSSLAEDDLILSKNGVFGIVEVNNMQTNNRYMRERSAFINEKLLKEKYLSDAVSFVYKNRYYLAVPTDNERNGAVYVSDPRFKNYRNDDIDSSFNYEWWYWENVPARVFAEINGQLWFGCADGRICRFDDKFTDRTYEYTGNNITFGDGVIACDSSDGEKFLACDKISFDGVVYKDDKTDDASKLKGTYYVKSYTKKGNGYNIEICEYKSDDEEEMEIPAIKITGSIDGAKVKFHTIKNVCSTWYTPIFNLGATDVLKTLLKMTISVDPMINGNLKFGYDTRDIGRMLDARGNKTLDFSDLSFEEFSFAADFATSFTVKNKVRKFNYIMFKFISDNDKDCGINNFKAVYTLTASHRGVF